MCRARDRIWDSRMPGNVMGTTEQLVSTFFRNKNSDKRRNDICVAKCRNLIIYVKPEFEKKKIGSGERRSDMQIAF